MKIRAKSVALGFEYISPKTQDCSKRFSEKLAPPIADLHLKKVRQKMMSSGKNLLESFSLSQQTQKID